MEASELILKPITLKNILLLSPGNWNGVDYTELEIQKAFNATDWSDRKYTSLYLDHQDTKERGVGNWVGYIKNQRLNNNSLYGDLEIWNPMIGAYLSQAKAKFGVSATLAGRENKREGRMEDFHYESFSIVTDPACKPAMINLAETKVNMVSQDIKVVTMDNEVKEDLTELESVKHQERRENIEGIGNKTDFCSALKAAKMDEKKAPSDYDNLKSLTMDEDVKKQIDSIIADEIKHYAILESIEAKKELANEGSPALINTLEPVEIDKKKKEKELGDKIVPDTVHDTYINGHSIWIKQEGKELTKISKEELKELLSSEKIQAWSSIVQTVKSESDKSSVKENSEFQELKGGYKMPEITENESVKVAVLETAKAEVITETLKEEPKKEPKEEKKSEDKDKKSEPEEKEDKEEMSKDAILNKVKEMSAEELVTYTNFIKTYLNDNKNATAKEVTLAYEKSKTNKELSASDLLASLDSRIASLKELDSSKTIAKLDAEVKELQAKVKTPDRKTLSVAYDSASSSNLGMLNFLQHRIN